MTVRDLIQHLEEYDEDTEVRLMSQENWPFEYSIKGVVHNDLFPDDEDEYEEDEPRPEPPPPMVYLVEGSQLCYGNKVAWECC